jgi:serine/threonine protein kinase
MLSIEQGKDYDDVDEKDLPYIHVQQLGHGHSGTVEEVKDQMTGQVYARKTIRITGSKKNRAERSRVFWNEVSIIRGLGSHRHIIGIHATYVTRRDFGILLWPVASEGDLETFLDNYIQHAGELPQTGDSTSLVKSMAPILEQGFGCLVSGLAFMHKNRIRHKDIKPRNILVHRGSLIYTDFGYSFDSNGFSHSTTEGRPDFLTRRYSPPESLQHEERNSKSDIYSLGCVLLDIFVALTQAINYDENALFSSVMSSIHEQLDLASVPLKWVFVPPVLKSMTMLARQDRPSAHHLMTIFQAHEGFFCNVCGPSETECSTGVTFSSYTRKLQALALNLDTEPTGSNNTFHLESNPGTASMSPYYTPWTWSETHKLYYCSRLSGDKILDTLWAHRSTAGSLFFSPEPETPSYNSAMQTMSIEVPHSNVDTISSGGVGVTYPPRPYTSSPQPIVSSDHVTLNNRSVTLPEDVQTRSQNMEQRFTLPRVESRVKLDAGETLDPRTLLTTPLSARS